MTWAAISTALISTVVSVGVQMAISALTPPKKVEGPRLGDLKVQASTYGTSVYKIYGTLRVAGNLFWSTPIIETANKKKLGKGGPKVISTTYTYAQSFAIGLCEGPIVGIRRIWINGELYSNMRSEASRETLIYSAKKAQNLYTNFAQFKASLAFIRIYHGTDDQLPDPLIQAYEGSANTPAYRGLAYVVFDNLPLEAYGNRTPIVEFEVISKGAWVKVPWYMETQAAHFPARWEQTCVAFNNQLFIIGGIDNSTNVALTDVWSSFDSKVWTRKTADMGYPSGSGTRLFAVVFKDRIWVIGANYSGHFSMSSRDGKNWELRSTDLGVTGYRGGLNQVVVFNDQLWIIAGNIYYDSTVWSSADGCSFSLVQPTAGFSPRIFSAIAVFNGQLWVIGGYNGSSHLADVWASSDGITWIEKTADMGLLTHPKALVYNNLLWVYGTGQVGSGDWLKSSADGITWTTSVDYESPWGLSEPSFAVLNDLFYVIAGQMADYTDPGSGQTVFSWAPELHSLSAVDTTVGEVVTDLCLKAGLNTGDIDVTQLTAVVDGYALSKQQTVRESIEALMRNYYFDAIESDQKIKFVTRGGAVVLSIPEADLAAHSSGSALPDQLSVTRLQEIDLPIEIALSYLDAPAGYVVATQYSRRLTSQSKSKLTFQVTIAMTAAKAKQVTDVILYNAWTERNQFKLTLSTKYTYLEPTDVIEVVKDGTASIIRLTDKDEANGILSFSAVMEDGTVYTQNALPATLPPPPDTIPPEQFTTLMLMDIPLLRDQDDGAGFYAAATGSAAQWPGAQLYRSTDEGASWAAFGEPFILPSTMGIASTVLGDFTSGNIVDELNTVTVAMIYGTLESTTEIAVFNGAHTALLGDEIIQYKNATLIATGIYQLSGLLRGRRGTEWAMGLHTTEESFVLFDETETLLEKSPAGELGLERLYAAVQSGTYLDSAPNIYFTNTGAELKPYAPVHPGGGRNAAGDITLHWTRRTRLGGAWNNFVDVPPGEAYEQYLIEIYSDSSYTVLKRTLTANTATVDYSSSAQTTDFGGNQAIVYWQVTQLSAVVGPGTFQRAST